MTVTVGCEMGFNVSAATRDELERDYPAIMNALLTMEAGGCTIRDAAVSVDLGQRKLTIEVVALGEDIDDAMAVALACIRTAIHEVGGDTRDDDFRLSKKAGELIQA